MLNHGLTSMALLLATIVLPSTAVARDACMVVTGATGWVASHVVNDALSVRRNPPAGCMPPPSHDAWPLTHSLAHPLSHSPHPKVRRCNNCSLTQRFVSFRPHHCSSARSAGTTYTEPSGTPQTRRRSVEVLRLEGGGDVMRTGICALAGLLTTGERIE